METTAKERVEKELEELCDKIVKLTAFLYSAKILTANLSDNMVYQMEEQLHSMRGYAKCLQARLKIWGKTNEDFDKEYTRAKLNCIM